MPTSHQRIAMRRLRQTSGPWLVSLAVLLALVAALFFEIRSLNRGTFIYPQDDTYIHMAMARNAAVHGVWGVTRHAFTSASSSPLWTFLLQLAYGVFGSGEMWPLALNLLAAALALWAAARLLNTFSHAAMSAGAKVAVLLVAIACTPLHLVTLLGMEHTLHAALAMLFLHAACQELALRKATSARPAWPLLALAPLLTTSRYEGLFLVALTCLWLLAQRRVFAVLALGIVALLPVALFGLWAQSQSWYFLPVSVLLKGARTSDAGSLLALLSGFTVLKALYERGGHLLPLIAAMIFMLFARRRFASQLATMLWLSLGALWLHLQFAQLGWLMRYEAYWIFLSIPVIGVCASHLLAAGLPWPKNMLGRVATTMCGVVAVLLFSSPLLVRAIISYPITRRAATNMYEQQYQTAQFLKTHYAGTAVAINDIGMVAYHGDNRIIDLWGLGTLEVSRLRLQNRYSSEHMRDITRAAGAEIAIIYDGWFPSADLPAPPAEWVRIGTWTISNNVAAAFDTVTFYATTPDAQPALVRNLASFGPSLPSGVKQAGVYMPAP